MPETPAPGQTLEIVAVCVGNTSTSLAAFLADKPVDRQSVPSTDTDAAATAVLAMIDALTGEQRHAVVIASVNQPASDKLEAALKGRTDWPVFRIGRDVDIPMQGQLDPEAMTGHDRILAALAAWETMKQAVIVVDAGTAITVDFVDGKGVFQGGAIAPGIRMALAALHEHTAALPEIEFTPPPAELVFGRNTAQAMTTGVVHAARGFVRTMAERYAEEYGAYPAIIATGGDAHTLFDDDDLIERINDDLVLRGIVAACRAALNTAAADADDD